MEKYIVDDEDRQFWESHYRAIAERLVAKRLWRNPWSIEVDGCIFNFTVKGYAKRGSAIWQEQQEAIAKAEGRA